LATVDVQILNNHWLDVATINGHHRQVMTLQHTREVKKQETHDQYNPVNLQLDEDNSSRSSSA
jgi:hypothetical protein